MLAGVDSVLHMLPNETWSAGVIVFVDYLLLIPGIMFWMELSTGPLRRLFQAIVAVAAAIAVLGLGWYFIGAGPYTFLRYNSLLAICSMAIVSVLVAVPGISRKYLVVQSLTLRVVMPTIALITVYVNAMWFFGVPPAPYIEPLAFAGWISAIGFEAARHTFANEKRLLTLEGELEAARQIQFSILPDRVPTVPGMRIAVTYNPMSAVAGDFYQFLQTDDRRIGILVADVSGHGIAAALIASMIKVAMQSASAFAPDPGRVLQTLNQILTPELRGSLTSAAYLWIDTNEKNARYSAAGHPALLQWNGTRRELLRIESNGPLFGIAPEYEYPVCDLPFCLGDRFLVYSDGLVEPENTHGESFGDRQLESVLRENRDLEAPELSRKLLSALRIWQPAPIAQQDDITLVLVDVV
jgi:sigma-B regulation protein RsbU (phosphoserine phosphatase)